MYSTVQLGRQIGQKGRLQLANGLIISKLIYLIPIWGGTHENNIRKVTINCKLRRQICYKYGGENRIKTLMEKCGWFFVTEMVKFHSLVALWKIVRLEKPRNLSEKIRRKNSGRRYHKNSSSKTPNYICKFQKKDYFPMEHFTFRNKRNKIIVKV